MTDDVRRRIGENIRRIAKQRGMTLRALSKAAHVGEASVYRVVAGKAEAGTGLLSKVAAALGADVRALLDVRPNVDTMRHREVVPMPDMNKEESLRMRVDALDKARLEALAAHYALTVSGVVRMLAKRDADALGLTVEMKRARGKK